MSAGTLATAAQATPAGEVSELELQVQSRLRGRVRDFRIVSSVRGVILRGRALSYYTKQLAQHAVMEMTWLPILANEIEVP
jgi:hypothetical protein